jgi:hypothetical protein
MPTIDDDAALELALKLTLEEKDQDRVEQVQNMLADPTRTRDEVLQFCAYHRQMDALKLRPWEIPPCWIDADDYAELPPTVAALAKQMRAAGISLFHPDPKRALAEADI